MTKLKKLNVTNKLTSTGEKVAIVDVAHLLCYLDCLTHHLSVNHNKAFKNKETMHTYERSRLYQQL